MRGGHVDAVSRSHVAGWAADSDQPDRALELCILVDGAEYGRSTADRPRKDVTALGRFGSAGHGFHFVFTPPLAPGTDHTVGVRYADTMEALPNGDRMLARDPAPQPPLSGPRRAGRVAAPLRPVLVTAPGRSGTTYLMSCLAAAPQIVAAALMPYEVRLLAYYATAFGVLTAPADLERSTHPDRLEGDGVHVGSNPFSAAQYAPAFHDRAAISSYHENWVPERLGAALAETISEYYALLAADQGKSATMFAEKNNNLSEPTRRFVRRAFPGMREIAIARDPRDVLCSHMAYFSSSPEKAFRQLGHSCRQMLAMQDSARDDTRFVRYEDLVLADKAAYAELSAFLDTTVRPSSESADAAAMFQTHGTSASPRASIGRWRRDLPAELRARSSAAWGDFLDRFGYARA